MVHTIKESNKYFFTQKCETIVLAHNKYNIDNINLNKKSYKDWGTASILSKGYNLNIVISTNI